MYKLFITIVIVVITGALGFILGSLKSFSEQKQKVYCELLPPIIKMAYNPKDIKDENKFSMSLAMLWLYGSKKVITKMENALSIMHNPNGGDITQALQKAIIEMRQNIQPFSWPKILPEEVNHLYTKIVKKAPNNSMDRT